MKVWSLAQAEHFYGTLFWFDLSNTLEALAYVFHTIRQSNRLNKAIDKLRLAISAP